ncbi:hypothetical protein E5676_scaffold287G00530 [Cucumis melo var. makuwa]|uniref:Uncharacterized protein n=1 Tax=Cucumis melo var. makuwa TaxID=1194695 RepID=A0A5D3C488_CUCMM|nr:hypothetical protein E5676_scaffold287G00530 [Cucumis melo var. makuwa]
MPKFPSREPSFVTSFLAGFSIRHGLVSCVDVIASSSADRFCLTVISDVEPSMSRLFSRVPPSYT